MSLQRSESFIVPDNMQRITQTETVASTPVVPLRPLSDIAPITNSPVASTSLPMVDIVP